MHSSAARVVAANIATAGYSSEIGTGGDCMTGLEVAATLNAGTTYIGFKVGGTTNALDWARDETGAKLVVTVAASNSNTRPSVPAQLKSTPWPIVQLYTLQADQATTQAQTSARAVNILFGKVV